MGVTAPQTACAGPSRASPVAPTWGMEVESRAHVVATWGMEVESHASPSAT